MDRILLDAARNDVDANLCDVLFGDVRLPDGAMSTFGWNPSEGQLSAWRVVQSAERQIGDSIKAWANAVQRPDGTIDTAPTNCPVVSVAGVVWEDGLSAKDARELAAVLLDLADQADRWCIAASNE